MISVWNRLNHGQFCVDISPNKRILSALACFLREYFLIQFIAVFSISTEPFVLEELFIFPFTWADGRQRFANKRHDIQTWQGREVGLTDCHLQPSWQLRLSCDHLEMVSREDRQTYRDVDTWTESYKRGQTDIQSYGHMDRIT